MIYLRLFWEFFKTGLFAIGGGMATVPFLQRMSVKTGWFTFQQLADMIAISESTPGPVGVNMATYVGNVTAGIAGGAIATIGLITPSVIIILLISMVLDKFKTNKYVQYGFYGIRPASVGLIANACLTIILICFFRAKNIFELPQFLRNFDWRYLVLAAVLLVLTRFVKKTKKMHPIWTIAIAAAVGIIFRF